MAVGYLSACFSLGILVGPPLGAYIDPAVTGAWEGITTFTAGSYHTGFSNV